MKSTKKAKHPNTQAERMARVDDDSQDLRTWLTSLGAQDVTIKVYRRSPKNYGGVNVEGTVGTYSEFVDEDTIRDDHGGGIFAIIVHQRDREGRLKYVTTRTLKIAGPPKVDALIGQDIEPSRDAEPASGGLASQAMSSMQWQLKEAREDVKRASHAPGFDPQMMRMMNEPMMEQLRGLRDANIELQRALADKDARLIDAMHRKPDTSLQDDLLKNMWSNESGRIEGLRAQQDSEMRQMKAFHTEEIARIREQSRDDMKERSRGHERELEAVKDSTRSQIDSIKISYEARIDGLKSETSRLNNELAQLKGEIGELRSRKDKSLTDQAEEIVKVQEAFKALGVGGSNKDEEDDDSNKPWYERAIGRVIDNPESIGQIAASFRPPQAAQPQQPQLPPPGQPFQGPDGKVYVMTPEGKAARLGAGVPPAVRKKALAAKAAKAAEAAGLPRPPDPGEMALAIRFMESAAGNGTDPATFAASARSAIPTDVLMYVEKVGIDEVLNKATLDQNSPLRSQAGRNFSREVARILLEGTAG